MPLPLFCWVDGSEVCTLKQGIVLSYLQQKVLDMHMLQTTWLCWWGYLLIKNSLFVHTACGNLAAKSFLCLSINGKSFVFSEHKKKYFSLFNLVAMGLYFTGVKQVLESLISDCEFTVCDLSCDQPSTHGIAFSFLQETPFQCFPVLRWSRLQFVC